MSETNSHNKGIETALNISRSLLTDLNLDNLLQDAVALIVDEYNLLGGVLLVQEGNSLQAKAIDGTGVDLFLKVINRRITDLSISVDHPQNFIVRSLVERQIYQSFDLYDFTKGVLGKSATAAAAKATRTRSAVSLPISYQNMPIGVLYLCKSQAEDFSDNLELLEIISNNLAIAIKNANLIKNLQSQRDKVTVALEEIRELRAEEQTRVKMLVHDLKNPLATISSVFQVIYKQIGSKSESAKPIDIAKDTLNHMLKIVDRFYSLSEQSVNFELTQEIFNLDEVLQSLIEQHRPHAQAKGLVLNYSYTDDNINTEITTDRLKFEEVINNLIMNAIKYSDEGNIDLNLSIKESNYLIEIQDEGVGISEGNINSVTTKYFQSYESMAGLANDSGKGKETIGKGLGLYIVSRYLDQMGGELYIESELGKGSKFSVVLPRK